MRVRTFALFVVLLLPASLHAQGIHIRLPWIGRRPTARAPLPPQAPVIAREMQYRASRLSAETYTVLSMVQTDHSAVGASTASMIGYGTHVDYRIRQRFSITSDVTQSIWGGPFLQNTFDFGGRYRPLRGPDYTIRPYVDLRGTLAWSYANFAQPSDPTNVIVTPEIAGSRNGGHGRGLLAGAGFETSLSRQWSITTGVSVSRYRMTPWAGSGQDQSFGTTASRVTIGVKYNPGRMVPLP